MRGDEGDLGIGARGDPNELEILAGESGRGEAQRDCTGDLASGPEMKLPDMKGGEGAEMAVMTGGELEGTGLVMIGADTQDVRVFWSWEDEVPVLLELAASECCFASRSQSSQSSFSFSSSFFFQLKPRPKEVTPQLFPTLAAR